MLWDMSSIEDANKKSGESFAPGLMRWGPFAKEDRKDSRRSVDSMQSSWGEVIRLAERKAARTSETIPVPAPTCTTGKLHKSVNQLRRKLRKLVVPPPLRRGPYQVPSQGPDLIQ